MSNAASDLRRSSFNRGGWTIISQKPKALRIPLPAANSYLNELLTVVGMIEQATGHQWDITSYIRNSPSHKFGISIDVSPSFTPAARSQYAAFRRSDPVLYKRTPLIRSLQSLAAMMSPPGLHDVGVFIECDHLHIQLFRMEAQKPRIRIVKWKAPKPLYSDTHERMRLPMTTTGY